MRYITRQYHIKATADYAEKAAAVTDGRNGQLYDYINDNGDTRDRIYNELGAENNWYGVYECMSPMRSGRKIIFVRRKAQRMHISFPEAYAQGPRIRGSCFLSF